MFPRVIGLSTFIASAHGCASSGPSQGECDFVGDHCGNGCFAATGAAIDMENRCSHGSRIVFCHVHVGGGLSTMEGCAVDTRTGAVFVMAYAGIITGVPRFRKCTEDEGAIAFPAAEVPCPK